MMKRDMELFRKILLEVEINDELIEMSSSAVYDETFTHHVLLLNQAGLLDGAVVVPLDDGSLDLQIVGLVRLTNAGHEFLNAVRDPTTWEKTKEALKTTGREVGTVTLSVLTAIAIDITRRSLGLPPE